MAKYLDFSHFSGEKFNLHEGRLLDEFPIKAVIHNEKIAMFALKNGGVGTVIKLSMINGRTWDEGRREEFLSKLEGAMRLKTNGEEQQVNYSFSFSIVRRRLNPETDIPFVEKDKKITQLRIDALKNLAKTLEVQMLDMYLGITATPSTELIEQTATIVDRVKSIIDVKHKYSLDSKRLEVVISEFGDQLTKIIGNLAEAGMTPTIPRTEKELLLMTRAAWRPNYAQPGGKVAVERSLKPDSFRGPADFLSRDLQMEQYRNFWVADGALHFIVSLDEAPNPFIGFSARSCDNLLSLGVREGVNNIPFLGSFHVAFAPVARKEADKIFKIRTTLLGAMSGKGKQGFFRDKIAEKEYEDLEAQHTQFIERGEDMVRLCASFHFEVPIEYLEKLLGKAPDELDLINTAQKTCKQLLDALGESNWIIEEKTWYEPFLNMIPGAMNLTSTDQTLPRIYSSLPGSLHLVPFYNSETPEKFHGGNYFLTDANTLFIFEHFSSRNGTAANFSVCGSTGSGKSVTVQNLIMQMEHHDPTIMILDFGGGGVGSWSKLVEALGGVEIAFGDIPPPRVNPFHISTVTALPNERKKAQIVSAFGLKDSKEERDRIESMYLYLQNVSGFGFSNEEILLHVRENIFKGEAKIPDWDEFEGLTVLSPGYAKPGGKQSQSIKIVLELLLSKSITDEGEVQGSAWAMFDQTDVNSVITFMFESYLPPEGRPFEWPTMSDFRYYLNELNEKRQNGLVENARGEIQNFDKLINVISEYCRGGLQPYLDGQSNVDIRKKIPLAGGGFKEEDAKVVLCDMAGINDNKQLAIMMILVNEFMADILYNLRGKKGVQIRDEAWFFMKSSIAQKYLETDYRTARKMGYSTVTIAQNLSDFKSPVINNNTQNWVVCGLGSEDEINLATTKFKLSQEERALFVDGKMGLQKRKNLLDLSKPTERYGQILISNKSGKFFLRNKLSLPELWITTTDPAETFVINYYRKKRKDLSMVELVRWLATGAYKQDADLVAYAKGLKRDLPE
jgi:hypothetical protein